MRMRLGVQAWSYWIGRLLLGSAFIYAAVLKIGSPQDFADTIAAYRILPYSVVNVIALGLPLFELLCGLLVLTGLLFRIGLLGIVAILVTFTAVLLTVLVRGLSIDCGCFGAHSWFDSSPWMALVRDAILIGVALFIYRQHLYRSRAAQQATANK